MLTITPFAWQRLTQIQSSRPRVQAIRLKLRNGTFTCCSGRQRTRDYVIENDGSPTLLMTPEVAEDLADRTLDAIEAQGGRRLRLRPVNTSATQQEGPA